MLFTVTSRFYNSATGGHPDAPFLAVSRGPGHAPVRGVGRGRPLRMGSQTAFQNKCQLLLMWMPQLGKVRIPILVTY